MFEAYLEGRGVVHANQVYDVNAKYTCRYCHIPVILKSIDGQVDPYFSRTESSPPHGQDCPYVIKFTQLQSKSHFFKSQLEDILGGARRTFRYKNKSTDEVKPAISSSGGDAVYINTPKQLLNFCQSFPLETQYLGSLTVNDILLSGRNLDSIGSFADISGIRLVIGVSYKFIPHSPYAIEGYITTENRNELKFRVIFNSLDDLNVQKKRIFANLKGGKFYGHPIAILGRWEYIGGNTVETHIARSGNFLTNI